MRAAQLYMISENPTVYTYYSQWEVIFYGKNIMCHGSIDLQRSGN